MTRDEALDKIKKLLRMRRGGTQAEIETALGLAREIAARHGVDLAGVNPDEPASGAGRIGHEDTILGARLQWECKYAALIVQSFFNVQTVLRWFTYRKRGISFVGTAWDRQAAVYVYSFLVGHFRREWSRGRGRCQHRQAFMYGMYHGICEKLAERQPRAALASSSALVLRNQSLTRYMEETFGPTHDESAVPDGDAKMAKYLGYLAGRRTEIRGGIDGGEVRRRIGEAAEGRIAI